MTTTEMKVIRVFEDVTGGEEVTPKSILDVDLELDSLDCVEAIIKIEDVFDIELIDDDCEKCKTVEDFIKLVEKESSEY